MTSDEVWPDWRANVMSAIDEREKKVKRKPVTPWGSQFHIRMSRDLLALLHQAAKKREISLVGYVRRSLVKQLSQDLAMDVRDLLDLTPYPPAYGANKPPQDKMRRHPSRAVMAVEDDGTGYGDWGWG